MPQKDKAKKKKGIVLAGGNGTRFRPISFEIPKPLITVKKKPLLNYSIDAFAAHNVLDLRVIIKPADREDYRKWLKVYNDEFAEHGIDVAVVEESEPMGTFGFIAHHLGDWIGDDEVFVTNSDDIKDPDLTGMLEEHRKHGAHATIAVYDLGAPPEDYGAVVLDGKQVRAFLEKQKNAPSSTISIGMYVLSPQVFDHVRPLIEKDQKYIMFEKDVFPALAEKGNLFAFMHEGTFKDCGTLEKWHRMIQE